MKMIKVGDIIELGSYPQTKDGERKPIEWKVLKISGKKMLLHSVYGLDVMPYNDGNNSADWECCSLRDWLNGTFYKNAFTAVERETIFEEEIAPDYASEYSEVPGKNTVDCLFLLSVNDVESYYPAIKDRNCTASEYAAEKSKDSYWWLRSFGNSGSSPVEVGTDGWICHYGYRLNDEEHIVRPAMWINI